MNFKSIFSDFSWFPKSRFIPTLAELPAFISVILSPIKINKARPVSLIPIGEEANIFALKKLNELRQKNINSEMAFKGSLVKRMKRANQINSIIAIIIGDDELRKNLVTVKELDTGNQKVIKENEITSYLEKYIK